MLLLLLLCRTRWNTEFLHDALTMQCCYRRCLCALGCSAQLPVHVHPATHQLQVPLLLQVPPQVQGRQRQGAPVVPAPQM